MTTYTLENVAEVLGYSVGTISRAINNKKGVSEKTRKKILDALEQMGYQPNRLAQGLAKQKSNLIGVIVPDFANDFLGSIVHTIEAELESRGYHMLLFCSDWDAEVEKQKLQLALYNQVDGIILKPTSTRSKHIDSIPVPHVFVSQSYRDDTSWVDIDNVKSGYIATKYLLNCGYRKIAFIGIESSNIIYTQRYQGYSSALKEFDISSELYVFHGKNSINSGYDIMEKLMNLPDPPDAAFCCDDNFALGIMAYARDHKIDIPKSFGVIGFNDTKISQLPQIDLTTVSQPKEEIGKYSVQMLLNIIESENVPTAQRIILSPTLVLRSTTPEAALNGNEMQKA